MQEFGNSTVSLKIRVKIQLIQPEDDDSTTSEMDISHTSLPLDHSETDPLALNCRNPDLEGELKDHSSLPDAMDQDDVLGHGNYPDRGLASDTGAAPGRVSDFQSEEMDTTVQPLEVESYSYWPIESQDAGTSIMVLTLIGAKEKVRWPGAVDCILRYNPM